MVECVEKKGAVSVQKPKKVKAKKAGGKKAKETHERVTKLVEREAVVEVLVKSHALQESLPRLRDRLLAPYVAHVGQSSAVPTNVSSRVASTSWRLSTSEFDLTRTADEQNAATTVVSDACYPFNKVGICCLLISNTPINHSSCVS
jgi:hypothetical protein